MGQIQHLLTGCWQILSCDSLPHWHVSNCLAVVRNGTTTPNHRLPQRGVKLGRPRCGKPHLPKCAGGRYQSRSHPKQPRAEARYGSDCSDYNSNIVNRSWECGQVEATLGRVPTNSTSNAKSLRICFRLLARVAPRMATKGHHGDTRVTERTDGKRGIVDTGESGMPSHFSVPPSVRGEPSIPIGELSSQNETGWRQVKVASLR